MSASAAAVTPERIMQFTWGFVPTLVLEAAIKHRVFDVLDGGSQDPRMRLRRRPAHPNADCTAS